MEEFMKIAARIVPAPKAITPTDGAPLRRNSAFTITAPEADFGPVQTAGLRIRKLLSGREGTPVQVDLTVEPLGHKEGYRLQVAADRVRIVGNDATGLLYGVITLEQLLQGSVEVPALEVSDWPDSPIRGIKQECRYGSNLMERDEWMELLEDLASKKMNTLGLALYGCWTVQYDGLVSEYLYMPLKNYPQIKTPMKVKYFDPEQGTWAEYEKLPPIFCDNLLEDIFRAARDLGIQIIPAWNSLGHNTLLPAMVPETSPVDENGMPQLYGFCISNPATYELLFSIYDQLIDDYMIPYGMDTINLVLDEIHPGNGRHKDDIWMVRDPWCQCPACRERDKGDRYIAHAVKLVSYLKKRGMKGVMMAGDMLQEGRRSKLGWLGDRLMDAIRAADLEDTMVIDWWSYHNIESKNWIKSLYPHLGLRGVVAPWNGYHTWSITLQPLGNARILGEVNRRDGGEGILAYAMWDRACDRTHDAISEYGWGYEQAGSEAEVTWRYAQRHFGHRAKEAAHAYSLMDRCVEQRHTTKWSIPEKDDISNLDLLTYQLSPYNFSYVKAGKPYPRAFVDEALQFVLTMRPEIEKALTQIADMAAEARAIFLQLSEDPACDSVMALRQAYECNHYLALAQDWLAILQIHDSCHAGDYGKVAQLARSRYDARLAVLKDCRQNKERSVAEAMALRQHSIFLQMFADIADYAEKDTQEPWDLMNIYTILSDRSMWLR